MTYVKVRNNTVIHSHIHEYNLNSVGTAAVSAHLGKWLVLELKHVRLPHREGAVVELHEKLFCHVIGVVRRLRHLQ